MTLFICVDDEMGIGFNARRQSKDRVLRARMLERARGKDFFVSEYTAKQFEEGETGYTVEKKPEKKAGKGDFVFAEDRDVPLRKVETLVLYRWNRLYPADRYFRFDAEREGFVLAETAEFIGSSHEKITEEVYVRK